MKRKSIYLLICLFFLISISGCRKESQNFNYDSTVFANDIRDTYYGYLVIPSIDLNLGFYNEDSPLNTVSKNIEFIKTNIDNTYLLAAHSGYGPLAYFNDLKDLQVGTDIYLEFKDEKKHYQVSSIKREKKDGTIKLKKQSGMLILTTCDQIIKGYQLIVESKEV